jgi:hypothetical protein
MYLLELKGTGFERKFVNINETFWVGTQNYSKTFRFLGSVDPPVT